MAEINECSLEGIIIMEIEKRSVTESNRPCNEPEVIRGESKRSPSSIPVMGCYWGQDEHLTKKMVHEGEDEFGDKVEDMDNVSKLGSANEDKLEYINKGLDKMDKVMMEREEADGDTKDAMEDKSCTSSKTQESGWRWWALC